MYETCKQGVSRIKNDDLEQSLILHGLQKMKSNNENFHFRSEMLFLVNGDADSAVMLSFCKQRQERESIDQDPGHGAYWSMTNLGSVIGLSRTRLDSARHLLRKSGMLIERKDGWPAKLEYQVDLDLLEKQLILSTPEFAEKEEIPINQEILNFTGKNIHAALMLSYAMSRQRVANATLPPEKFGIYWPMQQKDWLRLIGLKRRKQESARKVLSETGCWKERQWGWPAQNEFHLDLDQLLSIQPLLSGKEIGHA